MAARVLRGKGESWHRNPMLILAVVCIAALSSSVVRRMFLAGATRYSCVATGNWSSTGTWSATDGGACGASVPGDTDKAILRPATTVTVDVNTTVGQSGAMTGTVTSGNTAIAIGNGTPGVASAKLIIAAGVTLHARGNVTVLSANPGFRTSGYWPLTVSQDATLEFDSSAAVDPTQNYSFAPDPATASFSADAVFRGTGIVGHPATITSNAGGGNGYSGGQSGAVVVGFYHSLTYTDFRNFGTASLPALIFKNWNGLDLGSDVGTLDHVRFYNSGQAVITSGRVENSILITSTYCENTLAAGCYYNDSPAPTAPATKTFTKNSNVGGPLFEIFQIGNWTLNKNWFYGATNFANDAAGSHWLSFADNVVLNTNASQGLAWMGDIANNYVLIYTDVTNFHGFQAPNGFSNFNATLSSVNTIFDSSVYTNPVNITSGGDLMFVNQSGSNPLALSITGGISLPGADSPHIAPGNLWVIEGGVVVGSITNNTAYVMFQGGEHVAVVGTESTVIAGQLAIFKGNIGYSFDPAASSALVRVDPVSSPCVQDVMTPSGAAYNAAYQLSATEVAACHDNQGNSYLAKFSSTPPGTGSNVTTSPAFVDDNRGIFQAGINLFGESACPSWVTSTVYTYTSPGAVCVSTSDASYFRGKTLNWNLVATNTSSATNLPGARDGTWRSFWEPSGFLEYRNALFAGTTYTVPGCASCDVSRAFMQSIRNGLRPQNAAYVNASAPLGYIGAMPPLIAGGGANRPRITVIR